MARDAGLGGRPQMAIHLAMDSHKSWRARTSIEFTGAPPFPLQLAMDRLDQVTVDGSPASIGDIPQATGAGRHRIVSSGRLDVAESGPLRRTTDPVDGAEYFSLINYPDPVPRGMFSLEQPREPLETHLTVTARTEATTVLSHAYSWRDGTRWTFGPVVAAPNKLIVLAGPYRKVAHDDGVAGEVPIELWQPESLPSPAAPLLPDARRALRAYRDHMGLDYPLDRCQIVLAPGVPLLGAFVQGLMILNTDAMTAMQHPVYRADLLTHELGHSWIGGRLDFTQTTRHKAPSELLEGLNTYIGRTVLGVQMPDLDPWDPGLDGSCPDLYRRWAQPFRDAEARISAGIIQQRIRDLIARNTYRATGEEARRLIE